MRAILIDDEPIALKHLEQQLKMIDEIDIIGTYTDPRKGKRVIEAKNVDIVFLDIHLPGISGLELAEILLKSKPDLPIVFVTAYDQFAVDAFKLNALDYLLKPVSSERLQKTIQRLNLQEKMHVKQAATKQGRLNVSLFRQLVISSEDQLIEPIIWRTTKVEQLFIYLFQHRGKLVYKSTLIELLWPDVDLQKAYAQLYTAIYHLRKTLEPIRYHIYIKNKRDGYVLVVEKVDIDVEEFESFILAKPAISIETVKAYERALAHYKGDYLQEYDYLWAEGERQRLRFMWVHASLQLVQWYLEQNYLVKALVNCIDICKRYPLEEKAHLLLMKILAAMGNPAAVKRQFQKLQKILAEELQEQPHPAIMEWYQNWNKLHSD